MIESKRSSKGTHMLDRSWEKLSLRLREEKVRAQLENTPLWLFQKKEEPQSQVLELPVGDDTEYGSLHNE